MAAAGPLRSVTGSAFHVLTAGVASKLFQQQVDDRRRAPGVLPGLADALVVDEAAGVGCAPQRGARRRRERRRLDLVAVGREALQPLPERAERPALGPEGQFVR